jgi:GntR family transcriptional regulator, rspAB operon transcriptional repressor
MDIDLKQSQLDRRASLRGQIYDIVRTLIVTGAIKPGETIDEKAIAEQLSVSRTPVREAVKKLSDEHLVDVIAQSATRAARIDRHEIEESYLIRRALEIESTSQAAMRITPKHIEQLSDILHSHKRALDRCQFVEAIKADDTFHEHIAMISNLTRLWKAIDISKAQIDRCRHMMMPRAGQAEATLQQHQDIIDALASGQPERAAMAMRNHLDSAYKSAIAFLDTLTDTQTAT